jgi:peptidase M50B-like protein
MTREAPASRTALLLAMGIYFVVHAFVPLGGLLLYPLSLLATFVHEMGHGLVALVTGGSFSSLEVFSNASGLAHTTSAHPWAAALVSVGGLLAPPAVGATLLAVSRGPKRARVVLVAMAVFVVVALAIWVRSTAAWIVLPLDALALAYFGVRASPRKRMVFAQLVGVSLAIDTWSGKGYLFTDEVVIDGHTIPSDISNFAHVAGGPYLLWGLLVFLVSCLLLAGGLWAAWTERGLKKGR